MNDPDNADSEINWTFSGNTDLTVTIDVNHRATITPPDSNWNGSETITFTATDPGGLSDQTSPAFSVNAINDAPVISNIPDQTVEEGQPFSLIRLDDYVNDVDDADSALSWSYSGNGVLTVNIDADRVATVSVPNENWNGSETIVFIVKDGHGLSDADTVQFTVNPVNDAPVVGSIPAQSINEGGSFTAIALDDFVQDPDNSDSEIKWTISGNVHLLAAIDTLTRTAYISTPDSNWFGRETLVFKAVDPFGAADSDSVVFTVNPVNDPPLISMIPDQMVPEGSAFPPLNLNDFVNDVDDADSSLIWQVSGNSELLVGLDSNHVLSVTPPSENWNGSERLHFRVSDSGGLWDSTSALFVVSAVNDSPKFVAPLPMLSFNEDDSLIYPDSAWYAYVADPDNADSTLIFLLNSGKHIQVKKQTRRFVFSAVENWFGSDTLLLFVNDGQVADSAYFTVYVHPINDPPQITNLPQNISFTNDSSATLTMSDFAKDIDTPDSLLSWSFDVSNDSLVVVYDGQSTRLTLSAPGFSGDVELYCTLSDDSSARVSDTITVQVAPVTGLEDLANVLPVKYDLHQNYPNPFNPLTTIKYDLPKASTVIIAVYNILGKKVKTLIHIRRPAGFHKLTFDGSALSSGVYFYRIQAGRFVKVKKMILLK